MTFDGHRVPFSFVVNVSQIGLVGLRKPCNAATLRHFLNPEVSLWGDAQNEFIYVL